ncbi:MAG: c-type cytochrome [Deltaproteobacteria bacterium]|nr:c-type cytochrome [Deltaproteobacteria bacterium]
MRLAAAVLIAAAACNSGSAGPEAKPTTSSPTPTPTPSPSPVASSPASVERGAALYTKLCAQCHAKDGTGGAADHAPSLVNSTFLESATDDFLRRSIRVGRRGTSMGAYGKVEGGVLDDTGVDDIVAWIREKGPAPRALPAAGAGDAAAGEKLYVEYCQTCHGDRGKRGEAIHLANPQFQQMATDAFVRYAIDKGRPATKMQGFGSVMSARQIDDVTAYVRSFGGPEPAFKLLPAPTGTESLVINPKGQEPRWTPKPDQAGVPRFVSVDEVHKALAAGQKMIIVDARPESEWRSVHVTGAVSIPYFDVKRITSIPKDVWVVAYCACPHHLSGIVVDELRKIGHRKAVVLDEGINVWRRKGYPVVAVEGLPMPPDEPHNHGHDHGH